jgi:hypothetical protein
MRALLAEHAGLSHTVRSFFKFLFKQQSIVSCDGNHASGTVSRETYAPFLFVLYILLYI